MEAFQEHHRDYQRIAQAIAYLNENPDATLEQCAQQLHLSPEHFQKIFSRWAGVSPKQYTRFLKKEYAKECLQAGISLLETSEKARLSSTGRLHDLFIQFYAMTPAQYREQGKNLHIDYGFHLSPFGKCLIASTDLGLCKLGFYDNEEQAAQLLSELKKEWSLASIEENRATTEHMLHQIFEQPETDSAPPVFKLLIKGTSFQLLVWEALLKIPYGELISYGQFADSLQKPEATRAVSSAIARNNIALLIPCHRVIRQNGKFNQYRWGSIRKQALLASEASQVKVSN